MGTITTLQLSTSHVYLLRECSLEAVRRELATLTPGKIINGWRLISITHVGEIIPHENGGYGVLVSVERMSPDHMD